MALSNETAKNEALDPLDSLLKEIEEKLNNRYQGLEVWLPQPILTLSRTGKAIAPVETQVRLGYSETKRGWGLAIRKVRVEFVAFEANTNRLSAEAFDASDPLSIFDASRQVRIAALKVIPDLVTLVKEKNEGYLDDLKRNKQLADDL